VQLADRSVLLQIIPFADLFFICASDFQLSETILQHDITVGKIDAFNVFFVDQNTSVALDEVVIIKLIKRLLSPC